MKIRSHSWGRHPLVFFKCKFRLVPYNETIIHLPVMSMVTKADDKSVRLMKLSTLVSVSVASFLLIIKAAAWVITDSVSIQASLVDSIVDTLASLVNFFALRHSLVPADKEHRFGHGKIEAVAAQGQSVFIAGTAMWVMFEAMHRLIQPEPIQQTNFGLVVIIITIILTIAVVIFQRHVIKRTNSTVIKADHLHYKGDLYLNLSVIVSLVVTTQLGWWVIDALCGLLIGAYIMKTSWDIAKESFHILIDRELPDEDRNKISDIIKKHPEIHGFHDLKTRTSGPHQFIQLHLEMDGDLTLNQAHDLSNEVASALRDAFPQAEILIHQDPYDDRPEGQEF